MADTPEVVPYERADSDEVLNLESMLVESWELGPRKVPDVSDEWDSDVPLAES